MYHGVGEIPAPNSEPRYTVARADFARQLDLLGRVGARAVSLEQCLSAGGGGRYAVVFTFDDGEASVADHALPMMADRGMAGVAYVTSGWVGQPGYLTGEQLRALYGAGWTVGAHGVTHSYLSGLGDAELDRELGDARQALEALIGAPVLHMSLPGGRADRRARSAARRAGYRSLATSRPGRITGGTPALDLPRLTVLSGTPASTYQGLVQGHLPTYLKIMGRSVALDGAKYVLGDRRYDRLRGAVLRRLGR